MGTTETLQTVRPSLTEVATVLVDTVSWLRRATKPAEWSAVALSTLDALDRRGPQRVSELVAYEHITQPGMTGLIGRLGEAGLVERRADPTDRRAALVSITDAGRRYLDEVRASRRDALTAHLQHLAPEQQEALLDALPALAALTATDGASARPPRHVDPNNYPSI